MLSPARGGRPARKPGNLRKRIQGAGRSGQFLHRGERELRHPAGREIRIIVRPEEIDDFAAINLSKDIARKVEESLEFPGQIKVTVIRETRAIDYAK